MEETFVVETELMTLNAYGIEANSIASGGELISLIGDSSGETGTASFTFAGASGKYDIVVAYYDENDGIAQLEIEQNNSLIDDWNLDTNLPSDAANLDTATTKTISTGIEVNQGDSFTITGKKESFERARVDYVGFTPAKSDSSVLALERSLFEVNEAGGEISVPVVRTGDVEQTISVDYRTFEETATGPDFVAKEGTLTFNPGETTKYITIEIIDDDQTDSAETFSLTIDNITGNGTLDAPRTARVTIVDNDEIPDPVISSQTEDNTNVDENGGSDSYTIALGSQPNSDVTVGLSADDGVEIDVDTLTFTPDNWDKAQTVNVRATDDELFEGEHQGTITHQVSSEDSDFDGFDLNDLTVDITDNDLGEYSGTFILETFASGLNQATAFDWTPQGDRLFVAQQNGVVRLVDNGSLLDTPFINISDRVNNTRDRGLLGLAVHPDFPNQPYVYLAFTYDPPKVYDYSGLGGPDGKGNRPSRVIRVEADPSTNFTTALPGSQVTIVGTNSTWSNISRPDANSTNDFDIPPSGITPEGENIPDYLASDNESHSIGALQFGTDNSLFISNGDGTSYNRVDPRAVRVQDIDNLSGKILRVDPLTGEGLSDNPFYDGNPDSNRSKVYSFGLRNPFRFAIDPNTNEPYIGDVGWKTWEEINTGKGANFGWPYYEGGENMSLQQNEYQNLPEAQEFYNSNLSVTAPLHSLNHDDGAVAIIMGDFYTGDTFPDAYDNALFYYNFGDGKLRFLTSEPEGAIVNLFQDNVSGLTQISTGPDGNLYGLDRTSGQIISWRYDSTSTETIETIDNRLVESA